MREFWQFQLYHQPERSGDLLYVSARAHSCVPNCSIPRCMRVSSHVQSWTPLCRLACMQRGHLRPTQGREFLQNRTGHLWPVLFSETVFLWIGPPFRRIGPFRKPNAPILTKHPVFDAQNEFGEQDHQAPITGEVKEFGEIGRHSLPEPAQKHSPPVTSPKSLRPKHLRLSQGSRR